MKHILLFLPLLLLSCSDNSGAQIVEEDTEIEAVKESWNNYKTGLLEENPDKAIVVLDNNTIGYYNEMLDLVLKADSIHVNKLSILDKMMVLVCRVRVEADTLMKMNGSLLLHYAISNGMIGKNSVVAIEIDDIKIEGNFASATLVIGGKETPAKMEFNKENNIWKLDLTTIFKFSELAISKAIEESGQTENEYIMDMINYLLEDNPKNEAWKPVLVE